MKVAYKWPVCPDCGQQYRGNIGGGHCRAHYGGCCQTFANDKTGDAHRVGLWDTRRCLTVQEMHEKGWRLTSTGWTKYPPTGV